MHLNSSSSEPEKQLASSGFVQESSVGSGLASGLILLTPSPPPPFLSGFPSPLRLAPLLLCGGGGGPCRSLYLLATLGVSTLVV